MSEPEDKGPWTVLQMVGGERVTGLYSDDFEHDVRLIIDGDFGSAEDKLNYAKWMRDVLNAAAGQI